MSEKETSLRDLKGCSCIDAGEEGISGAMVSGWVCFCDAGVAAVDVSIGFLADLRMWGKGTVEVGDMTMR